MSVQLYLFGTKGGPRVAKGTSNPTSMGLVVDGKPYVIDAGLGITRAYVEAGLDLFDLEQIFITHLHSDHVLELGGLIHTTWNSVMTHPMVVHGPPDTGAMMEGFFAHQAYDIDLRTKDEGHQSLRELVTWHEREDGLWYEDDRVKVTALRVEHPPVYHCYALKFETADKTIVFGADTRYHPPLADFAKGADLLVHEAMHEKAAKALCERNKESKPKLWDHFEASHTLIEDVGRIATAADVKHLVLNHYVPSDDPTYPPSLFAEEVKATFDGRVTGGADGMVIEV